MLSGRVPLAGPKPPPTARCRGSVISTLAPLSGKHGRRRGLLPQSSGLAGARPGRGSLGCALCRVSVPGPCTLPGPALSAGRDGGRNRDRSPGLGAEEPCWRLCCWASPTPPRLSLPGWVLGPPVGPRPSLVLPPAGVGALPLRLPLPWGRDPRERVELQV